MQNIGQSIHLKPMELPYGPSVKRKNIRGNVVQHSPWNENIAGLCTHLKL